MSQVAFSSPVIINQQWAEFKAIVAAKGLLHQIVENDDKYTAFALDGPVCYKCLVWKDTSSVARTAQDDVDLAEMLSVYLPTANKPLVPKTPAGAPITAPTYMDTAGATGNFHGEFWVAPAGVQSFHDVLVTNQIYIQGGSYWVEGAAKGDYTEFSVVDKDDVLGLFATYGLTVGTDVLELNKYVSKERMKAGANNGEIAVDSKADVMPGLYLRASYVSTGATPVDLFVRYKWYEV